MKTVNPLCEIHQGFIRDSSPSYIVALERNRRVDVKDPILYWNDVVLEANQEVPAEVGSQLSYDFARTQTIPESRPDVP